jgi:opacity protein-like surface antigen
VTGRHAAAKRPKKTYEDDDFAKMVGRMILALERRASENPDALAYMLTIQDELRAAVDRAGYRLGAGGEFSLREIAKHLGYGGHPMSPQNAIKRWGAAAMARKMNVPSITQKINERRDKLRQSDELAARRAARKLA